MKGRNQEKKKVVAKLSGFKYKCKSKPNLYKENLNNSKHEHPVPTPSTEYSFHSKPQLKEYRIISECLIR